MTNSEVELDQEPLLTRRAKFMMVSLMIGLLWLGARLTGLTPPVLAIPNTIVCHAGSGVNCQKLAHQYRYGLGVPVDKSKAWAYVEKACTLDWIFSCNKLGHRHAYGWNKMKVDYAKSKTYYEQTCAAGSKTGCYALARHYYYGRGEDTDHDKSAELLLRTCEADSSAACNMLGISYEEGHGLDQSFELARQYYERACNVKNGYGCRNLGLLYLDGRGIEQDVGKALTLLSQACDLKHDEACAIVGDVYSEGRGVASDPRKSIIFFQKSCDLEWDYGCFKLAEQYENGHGVAVNLDKAADTYKTACIRGYLKACSRFTTVTTRKQRITANKQRTEALMADYASVADRQRNACENGVVQSCFHYADHIQQGHVAG